MDIRQLVYFAEVVKRKGFSKAGESLHITQPTISKMIKSLEDELGLTLLERSTKKVELTDIGEVVYKHALHVVQSLESLEAELDDVRQVQKGHIRMGLLPMIGYNFISRIIAEFQKLHPQITIQILENGAREVEHCIAEGDIDLGIVVLPVSEAAFECLPVVEEHLKLVVHPTHRLASCKEIHLEELKDETFIFYPQDFALYYHIKEACLKAGFQPNVLYESSQWDFISEMVADNLGIAFLPDSICPNLDSTRIKVIPLASPGIPRHLAFIWRRNAYLKFAAREFISFAKSRLRDH
ncbi:LysR family transcriptional regulator [Desulfosporosinus sp. PR]|uniref:LysR family transcriptional regulator n=1 Tax=Candidatus Desulfosporosinus nitrosoreducens TaxID=3401928 RepID=UPI0027F34B36|nr:LysR family transcriptional regulator [Desulfosporosinus sp. PR]MDQ7097114.1 LysR family transcriptional regulator [Desulfosporosinus sp. PR]